MAFASSSPIELALRSSVVTTVSTLKTSVDGLCAIKTNRIKTETNSCQFSIDLDSLYDRFGADNINCILWYIKFRRDAAQNSQKFERMPFLRSTGA
jgi:hypothetical protein